VAKRAQDALLTLEHNKLAELLASFHDTTEAFANITKALIEITEEARKDPVGDAVGLLTPTIRRAGALLSEIAGTPTEPTAKAEDASSTGDIPQADASHTPPDTTPQAPPPGAATNSTSYGVIADEYVAMFGAAQIDSAKAAVIDKMRQRLLSHRAEYEGVGATLNIPWHFIGLVHAMESNFNFAGHLHNGDSLAHRTSHEPKGRPEQPDPPYAWSTSAIDALTLKNLQLVENWTLSRQCFELERYNGFGYRFRGLASPYLWSFSDRYVAGKFVSDGVFDRDAVSKQAGAAVILKALIEAGDIDQPPP
jgi:lysozyme family protein